MLGIFRQGGKKGHIYPICSSQHQYPFLAHERFFDHPCLHRARPSLVHLPTLLHKCLRQGCDLVKRGKRKNLLISTRPPHPGCGNGCGADTWYQTFGLICENLCNFFFSCATLHTNHQITNECFVILGVRNSFFGAFSFREAGGNGTSRHPALHLYFGPKM